MAAGNVPRRNLARFMHIDDGTGPGRQQIGQLRGAEVPRGREGKARGSRGSLVTDSGQRQAITDPATEPAAQVGHLAAAGAQQQLGGQG